MNIQLHDLNAHSASNQLPEEAEIISMAFTRMRYLQPLEPDREVHLNIGVNKEVPSSAVGQQLQDRGMF